MESQRTADDAKRLVQLAAIGQWWFFNVVVIIANKYIFQVFEFKFPLSLTTVHFIMSGLGAYICIRILHLKPLIPLAGFGDLMIRVMPVAAITCLNIVLGNVSLRYVPVSFMQTIKSFSPIVTVMMQRLFWGTRLDPMVYVALIPIVLGVAITTGAELSFDWIGFIAAFAACFTTSFSNILAEILLQGKYKFDSINTVYRMAPISTLLLIFPALLIEGRDVLLWAEKQPSLTAPVVCIILGGAVAFCLNFSLFYVIQATSAVTYNVAGNLKVALAIVISWIIFRNPMGWLSWVGCTVTIIGCTFYGWVQQQLRLRSMQATTLTEEMTPLTIKDSEGDLKAVKS